jgi:hypothetical protein
MSENSNKIGATLPSFKLVHNLCLFNSLGVVCSEHPEFRTAKQFFSKYDHKN